MENIYEVTGSMNGFQGLTGGLGNQLFVISTVLATAWENNLKPVFRYDDHILWNFNNKFQDTIFKNLEFRDKNSIHEYVAYNQHVIKNTKINYNSNSELIGYFQDPEFFDKYRKRLIETFIQPSPHVDITLEKLRSTYPNKKIISIQIRRGDYLNYNWNLPLKFYQNAINTFDSVNTVFIISTDDKKWCQENFPNIEILSQEDHIEFLIMTKLDGIIMSNSTFGWWIAYLGELKDVIIPDPWFTNPEQYSQNIYMKSWNRLSVPEN